jgi:hypothetical protein
MRSKRIKRSRRSRRSQVTDTDDRGLLFGAISDGQDQIEAGDSFGGGSADLAIDL